MELNINVTASYKVILHYYDYIFVKNKQQKNWHIQLPG